MNIKKLLFVISITLYSFTISYADIEANKIETKLEIKNLNNSLFKDAKEVQIDLTAQPMIAPRPKETTTAAVFVSAVHDGERLALKFRWKDKDKSEAGKLGEFSDALAIMFPTKEAKDPPPLTMGDKENPVHLFHWRAQYQKDRDFGKPDMKQLYPNMNPDMYPMEFKDSGNIKGLDDEKREVYSHGKAAGNPQSYSKTGVDEIYAEGFGTTAVIDEHTTYGNGVWKNGEWELILLRDLKREKGSSLIPGHDTFLAFAVWQGGLKEVGARKSISMDWTTLKIKQ